MAGHRRRRGSRLDDDVIVFDPDREGFRLVRSFDRAPGPLSPSPCIAAPACASGSHQDFPVRMSNSQPCQGHFTISPGREQRYSPGTFDSTSAVWMPCARLPPRCGQRLLSAKKSPPRLNTTILRPLTSTSLRWPGGISSTAATTWLAINQGGSSARAFSQKIMLRVFSSSDGGRARNGSSKSQCG